MGISNPQYDFYAGNNLTVLGYSKSKFRRFKFQMAIYIHGFGTVRNGIECPRHAKICH